LKLPLKLSAKWKLISLSFKSYLWIFYYQWINIFIAIFPFLCLPIWKDFLSSALNIVLFPNYLHVFNSFSIYNITHCFLLRQKMIIMDFLSASVQFYLRVIYAEICQVYSSAIWSLNKLELPNQIWRVFKEILCLLFSPCSFICLNYSEELFQDNFSVFDIQNSCMH
jgi:hypothetical protein